MQDRDSELLEEALSRVYIKENHNPHYVAEARNIVRELNLQGLRGCEVSQKDPTNVIIPVEFRSNDHSDEEFEYILIPKKEKVSINGVTHVGFDGWRLCSVELGDTVISGNNIQEIIDHIMEIIDQHRTDWLSQQYENESEEEY
ncbi:MAG: hypothetical protein WCP38_03825 [Chloroflexota bacterium]